MLFSARFNLTERQTQRQYSKSQTETLEVFIEHFTKFWPRKTVIIRDAG
jgi:hypothetical protein